MSSHTQPNTYAYRYICIFTHLAIYVCVYISSYLYLHLNICKSNGFQKLNH